ncbi:MAG: hypothetical protein KA774_04985 [Burkholderiaceae bacterium]|nr:hypothetical protein [Burkholderiaceae bacterium]
MLKLALALCMGGASTACALAAVGWTLYAGHPDAVWVAQCFAAWGFVAGLACGGLHLYAHGRPAPAPAALPPDAMASLVRATLARAAAERQARPGSAADRRPATEPAPATLVTPDTPVTPAAPPAATPAEVAARAEVATS